MNSKPVSQLIFIWSMEGLNKWSNIVNKSPPSHTVDTKCDK